MNIHIDLETYSEVDIGKAGAYRYVAHPSFRILLFGYSFEGMDEPFVLDFQYPEHVEYAKELYHSATVIHAHNANFERLCLNKSFGKRTDVTYDCSMAKSAYFGLPMKLAQVAQAIKLDIEKDARGNALIKLFCVPQKPTVKNGNRTLCEPKDYPNEWEEFKAYCKRDVEVEIKITDVLSSLKFVDFEKKLYKLDTKINDRGVYVDIPFAKKSIELSAYVTEYVREKITNATGMANPRSRKQVLDWVEKSISSVELPDLKKATVERIIAEYGGEPKDADVVGMLKMRQLLSKSSISKYAKILETANKDRRIRGLFQYYGATKTGRWAGRGVQLQNLPRGKMKAEQIAVTKDAVLSLDPESFCLTYGEESVPEFLSWLIRPTLIAPPDKLLYAADLSAIEARVLAWLAKEQWRLDVFNSHGKIYEASAASMFNLHLDDIDSELRQKGKVAELALGYGGGEGALVQMGALDMGISERELPEIKNRWRSANPNIVNFWHQIEKAVKACFVQPMKFGMFKMRTFKVTDNLSYLQIVLPSGRSLYYANPFIKNNTIHYWGLDDKKKWTILTTYGGKLTENVTQAIARDILANGMVKADEHDLDLVVHVHDEIVGEAYVGDADFKLALLISCMTDVPEWADGLPLKADGFISEFYKK
jgi:DNA polymerase